MTRDRGGSRACARKTETPVEKILVIAEKKTPSKDSFHPCEAIRKLCISSGLFQANIELADERNLKLVFPFIVERTASILQKWPILEPKIMSILGTRPWLALELFKRGEHPTGY